MIKVKIEEVTEFFNGREDKSYVVYIENEKGKLEELHTWDNLQSAIGHVKFLKKSNGQKTIKRWISDDEVMVESL